MASVNLNDVINSEIDAGLSNWIVGVDVAGAAIGGEKIDPDFSYLEHKIASKLNSFYGQTTNQWLYGGNPFEPEPNYADKNKVWDIVLETTDGFKKMVTLQGKLPPSYKTVTNKPLNYKTWDEMKPTDMVESNLRTFYRSHEEKDTGFVIYKERY